MVLFAAVPASPSTPVLLSKIKISAQYLAVSIGWSPPASNGGDDLTGYKLYAASNLNSTRVLIYDGSNYNSTYQFTHAPVALGTTYSYWVQALNNAGSSSLST